MTKVAEPQVPSPGRLSTFAAVLAGAALLSSWNPFAAPLGLLVGLAAGGLGLRALRRRRGSRLAAAVALALGALAAAVSGLVLALTAGAVTGEPPGEPVVKGRSAAEAAGLLDAARSTTRPARDRARGQLDRAAGPGRGGAAESAKDDAPLEPTAPPEAAGRLDEPE